MAVVKRRTTARNNRLFIASDSESPEPEPLIQNISIPDLHDLTINNDESDIEAFEQLLHGPITSSSLPTHSSPITTSIPGDSCSGDRTIYTNYIY